MHIREPIKRRDLTENEKEVIKCYNKSLEIGGGSLELSALTNSATIYSGAGQNEKAEEICQKILKLKDENIKGSEGETYHNNTHLMLGNIYQVDGRNEEATKEYKLGLNL